MRLVPHVFILCEERKRDESAMGLVQQISKRKKRNRSGPFKIQLPLSTIRGGRMKISTLSMKMKISTLSEMRSLFLQTACCLPRSSLMGKAAPREASPKAQPPSPPEAEFQVVTHPSKP